MGPVRDDSEEEANLTDLQKEDLMNREQAIKRIE